MPKFAVYRRVLPSVGPIIFRNFFILVNGIIFCVVVLLFVFGSTEAGLFLGIVFLLNTLIATSQDIHARVLLEKLQMLTALKVLRVNPDKTETSILAEEIKKGDLIELKLGDQTPCEGVLVSADNLEISEALVTGESDSFAKNAEDKIIAGAIVTSGAPRCEAEGSFPRKPALDYCRRGEKICGQSKLDSNSDQYGYKIFRLYFDWRFLLFVIGRGILLHAAAIANRDQRLARLASTIVPQGLVVVITLLFAIGAANYSRRKCSVSGNQRDRKIGTNKKSLHRQDRHLDRQHFGGGRNAYCGRF